MKNYRTKGLILIGSISLIFLAVMAAATINDRRQADAREATPVQAANEALPIAMATPRDEPSSIRNGTPPLAEAIPAQDEARTHLVKPQAMRDQAQPGAGITPAGGTASEQEAVPTAGQETAPTAGGERQLNQRSQHLPGVDTTWHSQQQCVQDGRATTCTSSTSGTNLSGTNLSGTNLSGTNLSGTNLSGTNLSGTNLSGTNLSGTNLSGTNLSGTNLSGTNLSGTNPNHFDIPEKAKLKYPTLGSTLDGMVTRVERGETEARKAAREAPISQGESVAVTIHLSGNADELARFLEENGGSPRNTGLDYIEAYVPVTLLGQTSEQAGVLRIRAIIPPDHNLRQR